MLGGIGLSELIVIFLVILLLFGAKALPEVAKGLAQAIKTFKKEAREIKDGFDGNETASVTKTDSVEVKKDTSNDFSNSTEKRDWRPKSDKNSSS